MSEPVRDDLLRQIEETLRQAKTATIKEAADVLVKLVQLQSIRDFNQPSCGESRPVVTRMEAFPVATPQPEFLPVSATVWARVDCVDFVEMFVNAPGMRVNARNGRFDVDAPYFAAWLDRLGIPWTDDLRKAHEAGKGEA